MKQNKSTDLDFFTQVATGLRALWPSGEKDNKYSWRDSIPNLRKRLQFIWEQRGYTTEHSVEDCLSAGRLYLSKFEEDTKYMQLLKYFIFKQKSLIGIDGKITYTYQSTLCDLLDEKVDLQEYIDNADATMSAVDNMGELV